MAKKLTMAEKARNEKISLQAAERIKRAYPIGQKVIVWRYTVGSKKSEWSGVVSKHYRKSIGISKDMKSPVRHKSKADPLWRPGDRLETTDSLTRYIKKAR